MEDDAPQSPPRRQQYQSYRSTASVNWRTKDSSPRAEQPQQQQRGYQRREQDGAADGYGSPRNNNSYSRQPREQSEIPTEVTSTKLYVGNLLYTASANDIEDFFTANGFQPTNVSLTIDPATGRNPSYCFVDLESVDEAKRAMEQLNGQAILGRNVRINPGVARKDGGSGGARGGFGNRSAWREGSDGPGYRPSSDRYNSRDNATSSPQQWGRNNSGSNAGQTPSEGKRIYVGGLPELDQATLEAEITQLFAPASVASISKLIAPHPSKASEPGDHHYLFVDLSNAEDVEAAIGKLNDSPSPWSQDGQGNNLKVNRAREGGGARRTGQPYGGGQRDGQPRGEGQSERTFGKPSWRD